jgi:hypothetical protein
MQTHAKWEKDGMHAGIIKQSMTTRSPFLSFSHAHTSLTRGERIAGDHTPSIEAKLSFSATKVIADAP